MISGLKFNWVPNETGSGLSGGDGGGDGGGEGGSGLTGLD